MTMMAVCVAAAVVDVRCCCWKALTVYPGVTLTRARAEHNHYKVNVLNVVKAMRVGVVVVVNCAANTPISSPLLLLLAAAYNQ